MIKFENLGGFFKENSKKAVDAAKETAAIAKIKTSVKAEELKLSSTYAEIGKLFCEQADEVDEIFIPLMEKVSDSKAAIAKLEAELDKLKKTVTCPVCGSKSPAGSSFCASCGAEIPVEEVAEEVVDDVEEVRETVEDAVDAAEEAVEEEKTEEE